MSPRGRIAAGRGTGSTMTLDRDFPPPAAYQQLRMLGVEQSTQALVTEGINAVFERHGKPLIA